VARSLITRHPARSPVIPDMRPDIPACRRIRRRTTVTAVTATIISTECYGPIKATEYIH